jgi:hypothetical protein
MMWKRLSVVLCIVAIAAHKSQFDYRMERRTTDHAESRR